MANILAEPVWAQAQRKTKNCLQLWVKIFLYFWKIFGMYLSEAINYWNKKEINFKNVSFNIYLIR
jgi:hypothetical protein